MGCAGARQASFEQRGLLDFFAPEGVDVRDVAEAGVEVPDWEGLRAVGSIGRGSSACGCVGEALRRVGGSSCRVAESCRLSSATVLEGERGWCP